MSLPRWSWSVGPNMFSTTTSRSELSRNVRSALYRQTGASRPSGKSSVPSTSPKNTGVVREPGREVGGFVAPQFPDGNGNQRVDLGHGRRWSSRRTPRYGKDPASATGSTETAFSEIAAIAAERNASLFQSSMWRVEPRSHLPRQLLELLWRSRGISVAFHPQPLPDRHQPERLDGFPLPVEFLFVGFPFVRDYERSANRKPVSRLSRTRCTLPAACCSASLNLSSCNHAALVSTTQTPARVNTT